MVHYLWLLIFSILISICLTKDDVQLTSTNNNFMSMIAGFTARIQCSLYICGNNDRFPNPIVNVFF